MAKAITILFLVVALYTGYRALADYMDDAAFSTGVAGCLDANLATAQMEQCIIQSGTARHIPLQAGSVRVTLSAPYPDGSLGIIQLTKRKAEAHIRYDRKFLFITRHLDYSDSVALQVRGEIPNQVPASVSPESP